MRILNPGSGHFLVPCDRDKAGASQMCNLSYIQKTIYFSYKLNPVHHTHRGDETLKSTAFAKLVQALFQTKRAHKEATGAMWGASDGGKKRGMWRIMGEQERIKKPHCGESELSFRALGGNSQVCGT